MKYFFPAILKKDKQDENIINVSFPDLLGVYTFGTSRKEAISMAQDVLKETLLSAEECKNIIPTPIEKLRKLFEDVVLVEVKL